MNLSKVVALATAVVVALSFAVEAEAKKRLGGGGSMGMQRSAPAKNSPNSPPAQQASPAQNTPAGAPQAAPQPAAAAAPMAAAAPAAAAAQKRSWLGPIAGLAAGLGIAALLSHFGMGEAVANFVMMALLVLAGALLIGFLIRRFRGAQGTPAMAGAGAGAGSSGGVSSSPWQRETAAAAPGATPAAATTTAFTPTSAGEVSVTGQPLAPLSIAGASGASETPAAATPVGAAASSATSATWGAPVLPEGFDAAAFERVAKMIFIRLQAANDAGNLEDLRQFTTPEMFAAIRLEIQERTGSVQVTDVQRVDAQILDFATQEGQQVVSVRFHGMIREDQEAAEAFDEVWHLCRPVDESRAWAIAGIQQAQ